MGVIAGAWRSAFGRVAMAWIILAVGTLFGFAYLADALPYQVLQWLMIGVFAAGPAALLLWSVWAIFRAPRHGLLVLIVLVVAAAGLAFGGARVMVAGAWLKFTTQRQAYERVVADAQAGRLPRDGRGCAQGRRDGLDYSSSSCTVRDEIVFPWGDDALTLFGVIHDRHGCPPPKPEPGSTRVTTGADGMPIMKNAGVIGQRWQITGHYCVIWATF